MHNYIPGKIVDIVNQTPRVKLFYWKADDNRMEYSFTPGQFAIIHFPTIEGSMPYRSYSIAGIDGNTVEFCISLKEEGAATAHLWSLKKGDSLEITEAKGDFILKEPIAPEVCFIATGTGIAPFKPMINRLINESPNTTIHLIYGNRAQKDIIYHELWCELEKKNPNFHYHPTLSQEKWEFHTGYVHAIYNNLFKDAPIAQFYICGWKEMISETRQNLKKLGYTRKQYFIESYN